MAEITGLVPTTELEAINEMLLAIGESPLDEGEDLSTVTAADVVSAITILRNTTREVLTEGWQFNTEPGAEVEPSDTYDWLDTDGVTTELNIFLKPSGVLSWSQTECSENRQLDLVERRAKKYTSGAPASAPMVLYDLGRNRDGADSGQYPAVYLDVIWAFAFEDTPEQFRRYVTVRAARRFAETVGGSEKQAAFSRDDEAFALRLLKRAQARKGPFNLLNTIRGAGVLGNRPQRDGALWRRVYPGGE